MNTPHPPSCTCPECEIVAAAEAFALAALCAELGADFYALPYETAIALAWWRGSNAWASA